MQSAPIPVIQSILPPVDDFGEAYSHVLVQFQKHRPDLAETIRLYCDSPDDAFSEGRRLRSEVRSDWTDVNIRKVGHDPSVEI